MNRRNFIELGGKTGLVIGALSLPLQAAEDKKELNDKFVHHVYFWFKEPDNADHHERFRRALKDLVSIDSIQHYHLGIPADTRREVIDSDYHYSLLTIFPDKAAHDAYQVHEAHDAFRIVAGELCAKVVVYDSVDF